MSDSLDIVHEIPWLLIHEASHFLVLCKPSGLLSVPGRGEDKQDCLSARVQAEFPEALIVHRLDMSTSGLIVMARDLESQRQLSRAFASRETGKEYVAVVEGVIDENEGSIDLPIAADWPNRPLRVIDHESGKPSLTHWRVVSRDVISNTTRLIFTPLTGRTHQLRLHSKSIGHPIVGDALYGNGDESSRLKLHASLLAFNDPANGERFVFKNDAPF